MKKLFGVTIFLTMLMLLLPLSVLKSEKKTVYVSTGLTELPDEAAVAEKSESFKVLIGDKITEYSAEEYITGVVAAEMPALYHEDALKAQAIAAYTFACCRKAANKGNEYDITADHTIDQSFADTETLKERWGENYEQYITKIGNAVKETKGMVITYNGEIITAAYHAISTGKTEDCKNVWGGERAYLKPVVSEGDKLATNYISEAVFTEEELREKFGEEITLEGEPKNYFAKPIVTESGTVTEINVCTKKVSGAKLQKLLNLRSSAFEVKYAEDKFIFTVYGAGHGVGMSQNGANYMAKQGSSYTEILKHYYSGCEIEK